MTTSVPTVDNVNGKLTVVCCADGRITPGSLEDEEITLGGLVVGSPEDNPAGATSPMMDVDIAVGETGASAGGVKLAAVARTVVVAEEAKGTVEVATGGAA